MKTIYWVRDTYSRARAREDYSHLTDKRWEMIKMEIRLVTMSYSKSKYKRIRNREQDILWNLFDLLDSTICNNFSAPDIDDTLKECENL